MKREQIIAQALGLLLAAGDDRHGVVAGDAAEHIGQLHRVDSRARRIGEPRQRLEQHNDPRIVHAHAALIQNELQALRVVDVVGLAGYGVAAAAAADRLLIKVQLLDIARDGRLLALDAALGETRDELLLRLDIVLFDQLFFLLSFCGGIFYRSSRLTGQDMQRGPPRPRDSSADGTVNTSRPCFASKSFVT